MLHFDAQRTQRQSPPRLDGATRRRVEFGDEREEDMHGSEGPGTGFVGAGVPGAKRCRNGFKS